METEDVLATAGGFLVRPCCADCLWVERISTLEGTDMPSGEVEAALRLPEHQRPAALERLWDEHF